MVGNMVGKLEEHLVQELTRTGYPLEIEVSSMLDNNYSVTNNKYFFDWEEKKAREIDIAASPLERKHQEAKIEPFRVVHRLVIECKKSNTHAWIFLTRPDILHWYQGQRIDFLKIATKDLELDFVDVILSTCKKRLHYHSFERVASTYAEIKYQGQRSKKSEIFEAKNQLVKFVAYDIFQLHKRLKMRDFDPTTNHIIWLYHPTIVFDGKLYEAIIKDGSLHLFERKHLLLSARYSPAYVKDFPRTEVPELPHLIDVVRKDFFNGFLQTLEKDYFTVWKCISNNLEKLRKIAKEFLEFKDNREKLFDLYLRYGLR